MNAVKGYFRPSTNKKKDDNAAKAPGTTVRVDQSSRSRLGDGPRSSALQVPSPASRLSSSRSSPHSTRPSSINYPEGDFRNSNAMSILDLRTEMMATHILEEQRRRRWSEPRPNQGVIIKRERGQYICSPPSLRTDSGGLYEAVLAMNVRAVMTLNTRMLSLRLNGRDTMDISLHGGLRLQVLPSIRDLPTCQKHHFAAFIEDSETLVVWDDEPNDLIQRAAKLESEMLEVLWTSVISRGSENGDVSDEKMAARASADDIGSNDSNVDLESAAEDNSRPRNLMNATMVGATLALTVSSLGLGYRKIIMEIMVDPKIAMPRLGLILLTPMQVFLALFFMQIVVTNLWQVLGPTGQLKRNSKFYSAIAPSRSKRRVTKLPHITIQCPVYKEGLTGVIQPTIFSVKAAMSTYEMQGGSANIFVNDDGMQLIGDDDAQARRDFYDEHNIGWVARPKHNPKPEDEEKAFLRRGKFKKASNMNYAFMVTNKVEDKLLTVERDSSWTQAKEKIAYAQCLAQVLEEEQGRAWADGNIRIGDYILLIDSDTRVPVDCLLDAANEMEDCPDVGILQYSSGVLQVADNFFENGVAWFTDLIYTAIRFAVSCGDVAPFVGHNAIIRWAAVQSVGYNDEDGYEKFWSESHVSEDFDMALRLQTTGYTIRLGSYTGEGFKEGVSLTVYDELNRWEKYAYGCNELLFHPIVHWPRRGPFTPLFRKFMFSSMPITSKVTICSYIGTYYAIGASWITTVANFFIFGMLKGSEYLSNYYLDSFKVYFSLIIVFTCLGNISLATLRYRMGESSFFSAVFTNLKWVPLFSIFLGGLSLHVSQALLSHMFSINMVWGATAKEVDVSTTFAREWRKVLKSFKGTFVFVFLATAMMVVFAHVVPEPWQVTDFVSLFPLSIVVASHFLLPVVLNPGLMMMKW